jgi:hypothetical protein
MPLFRGASKRRTRNLPGSLLDTPKVHLSPGRHVEGGSLADILVGRCANTLHLLSFQSRFPRHPQLDDQMTTDVNEKASDSSEVSASRFLEALYDDPLRAETARTGRFLIVASAICMTVVLFNVRLQSTSLVPIDFGSRIDVLPILIAIAVFLLLLSFLLRAITDLLRDREADLLVTRYIENERVTAAEKAARAADDEEAASEREFHEGSYPAPDPDPWWEPVIEIREAADAAVSKAEARIGIRRWPRRLRLVRKTLEVGVPVVFAVIALVLSGAFLATFFSALFFALKP